MSKKGQVFKKYSPEFKLSVILDMQEHRLCYHEVIRKFWGENVYEQNYIKQVQRWERKYLEEGRQARKGSPLHTRTPVQNGRALQEKCRCQ